MRRLYSTRRTQTGTSAEPFEAKLLADLEGAITEKREAVTALEVERAAAVERIDAQLATQRAALKRYEDTRKRLVGEPLRGSIRGPGQAQGRARARIPSRVSPEKIADIRWRSCVTPRITTNSRKSIFDRCPTPP